MTSQCRMETAVAFCTNPLIYEVLIFSDINECSINNGGCSQTCVDFQPDYSRDQTEGFRCLCAAGFIMAIDGSTCQGECF